MKLTAFSSIGFAVFCLLWVFLTYVFLPVMETDYSVLIRDPQWTLVTSAGLIASILGIFALFGLYHHTRKSPVLTSGIILLILGLMLELSGKTWDLFVWPVLCSYEQHLPFIKQGLFLESLPFMVFFILLLLFLFVGSLLTGIGFLKIKQYGKAPFLIIIGIVLYAAGNFTLFHLAAAGLCVYSVAFLMIGIKLFKDQRQPVMDK